MCPACFDSCGGISYGMTSLHALIEDAWPFFIFGIERVSVPLHDSGNIGLLDRKNVKRITHVFIYDGYGLGSVLRI